MFDNISESYYKHFFVCKGDFPPLFPLSISFTHIVQYVFTHLLSVQTHTQTHFTPLNPNNRHVAQTLSGQQETAVFSSLTVQQQ